MCYKAKKYNEENNSMKKNLHFVLKPMSSLIDDKILASCFREKEIRYAMTDYYAVTSKDITKTLTMAMLIDEFLIGKLDLTPDSIRAAIQGEVEKMVLDPKYKLNPTTAVKNESGLGFVKGISRYLVENDYADLALEHLNNLCQDREKCCLENGERFGGLV